MNREKLSSRLGFILLSAGCAIGIGNVWKFPYIVGENGGGLFVLIYLFFLAVLAIPVLTMELSLGRAAQTSPIFLYQKLEKKGTKWHWHGVVSLLGNYLVMMFYTTVSGWMLYYCFTSLMGVYQGKSTQEIAGLFEHFLASPELVVLMMAIVTVSAVAIISIGLQKGVESVTKKMMLMLLVIIVILAIYALTLPGGQKGLRFYLMPDFAKLQEVGIKNIVLAAMNQSFFTLSIGMGSMAIFGSYIGKERALLGESVNIAFLDTFVAICAGLIIFPACAAFGVDVTSGPKLLFITLPNVFNALPGGRFWGSIFFLFMFFAAFSSVIAVIENIISCTMDLFGWTRKKACLYNGIFLLVAALPCALGFNVWKSIHPLGMENILALEDYLVSSWILPLGSLVIVLFSTSNIGWGFDNFLIEANTGKGLKLPRFTYYYLRFVLPIIILVVFLMGLL